MSSKPVKGEKFYATMVQWDISERESIDKKFRLSVVANIVLGVLVVGLVATIIPLTTMHEFTPIPIVVDRRTAEYEVRVGKERMNVDEKNEQRMIADVAIHVRARESFSRGEAEQNFRIVFNQLPEEERARWRHDYVEAPTAWLKTLGIRDQIKLVNPSIQWLPKNPEMPNTRSVQFRFDKEERFAGRPATTQPMISTLTFTYDQKTVPNTIEDLATNPFGFKVLSYRRDAAGRKKELSLAEERATQ